MEEMAGRASRGWRLAYYLVRANTCLDWGCIICLRRVRTLTSPQVERALGT